MKEILINQLFAGAYLQEGTNIGHEVINLFCDDKGQHYIFVTPSGVVSNHDVGSIVFVQNIKAMETMEVIMMAEGLASVTSDEIQNISYAGISIKRIFDKNIYHGKTDMAQSDIYATYKAEVVKLPKPNHRILLTVDPSYREEDAMAHVVLIDPDKSRIVGQGMRTYLSGTQHSIAYVDLWIEDDKQVLVIENKIKSGLNGKTDKGETQLTKYYNCGQKYKQEHDNIKKIHYFIFLSNYNRINSGYFPMKEFYKIISYKDIYGFYEKYASEFIDDKYFPDFLNGLKNQTMSLSELRFSIMRSRFLEKTNQR